MLCLAVACLGLSQSPPAVDTVVRQVESHYNSAKTLTVNFTETYSILGHKRPPETGKLTLRKVGKMRWDYRQPEGKLFVSDGKTVYLYTARDNRVEKVAMKSTDDMRAPLAFLLGKLDMNKEFRNIQARQASDGLWLAAESKTDRLPYQSIEMKVVNTGEISELVVHGRDQSMTAYRFTDERLNQPVNDALFHFQIPAGAEVVDAIETHGDGTDQTAAQHGERR